jgi:hypothetical protein
MASIQETLFWKTKAMSHRLSLALILSISILASVECLGGHEDKKPAIRPRLAECTLSASGRTLKPVRVIESWRYEHPAGAVTISVEDQTVVASDAKTGKTAWKNESADGLSLEWLAANEHIAYFRARKKGKENESPQYEQPARVRRLQLRDHRWLTPLVVTKDKPKEKTAEIVVALLPHEQSLVVLTATVVDHSQFNNRGQVLHYRVTGFLPGQDAPAWSLTDHSAGSRSLPGAYLMASRRPDYATDSIQSLVAVGPNVLVCMGPLDDVICVEALTGKENWRISHIWEYRRGFVGPSVWTHHIARYGSEEDSGYTKERINTEDNAIVAGPVVVPAGKDNEDKPQHSIFVAVARSDKSRWAGYLADCVVYEVNELGKPIGIVTLPRMVNGWQHCTDDRGIVWACSRDAFVKLTYSDYRESRGEMMGGPDMLCHVSWYCQPEPFTCPNAWLTAGPAGDPVAFGRSHAFRLAGDSYILRTEDKIYHFPIRSLDLRTTQSEPLLLDVPFDGEVALPTDNYDQIDGTTHSVGPYLLGITWLEVRGDVLQIVLGKDSGACAVEFDLAGIGLKKAKP